MFDSGLERDVLISLAANPAVCDLREQQLVRFRLDGKPRRHWFDAVVTWNSGIRVAYAIRYVEDVDEALLEAVRAACDQNGDRFADLYVLLTELDIDPLNTANSRRILSCARDFDFEAQDRIRDLLARCGGQVSLVECDRWVGDGHRGARAAIALIQTGALQIPQGVRLNLQAVLLNCFTN